MTSRNENREQEQKNDRRKLLCKGYKTTYDFVKFKMIQRFENAIRNGIIKIDMVNNEENL